LEVINLSIHVHYIDERTHRMFLEQGRIDPFTKETIKGGDRVVFCAGCKSVFLVNSWEALGRRHCNQSETLREFPNLEHRVRWRKASPPPVQTPSGESELVKGIAIISTIIALVLSGLYFQKSQDVEQIKSNSETKIDELESKIDQLETNVTQLENEKSDLEDKIEEAVETKYTSSSDFYFSNNCHRSINLYLRYKQTSGNWVTDGKWSFNPNKSSYLSNSNNERVRLGSPVFYFYAEIPGTNYAWKGKNKITYEGKDLPMQLKVLFPGFSGDYTLSLICP
jgi:cell division protein FtsB